MANNYQLSHLSPGGTPNPSLRGGRQECYRSVTVAQTNLLISQIKTTESTFNVKCTALGGYFLLIATVLLYKSFKLQPVVLLCRVFTVYISGKSAE